MVRRAAPLLLRENDGVELLRLTRSSAGSAGLAARARIVLLAADGTSNVQIAELVGVSRPTVDLWRNRYREHGLAGLVDADRPGRPRQVDPRRIVEATLTPPPKSLGVTHWSSRLLAARLHVSHVTIAAAWRDYGVRPWKAETFKFSTDPELVAKVTDVIGLYLAHPRTRSCSAWTRRARCRRWTGPRRCCRCSPATPSNAPTTTSATAPPPCSPRSRSPPARSPDCASSGTATRSSWPSSSTWPGPTPIAATVSSCTW